MSPTRRSFLSHAGSGLVIAGFGATRALAAIEPPPPSYPPPTGQPPLPAPAAAPDGVPPTIADAFPTQAPELVREMVARSHFDPAWVRDAVTRQPSLARATWDWGFGDWESALGAASHVGNREIAELLLAHGARPDLFCAAMLGNLDAVRAQIAGWPGAQSIRGPHGITLLAHARAGGERALPVLRYLESLGGADPQLPLQPLADADRQAVLGRYRFGSAARDVLEVAMDREWLSLRRAEGSFRRLHHLGERAFSPAGAEAVRIRLSAESPAATLSVHDPDLVLAARRAAD